MIPEHLYKYRPFNANTLRLLCQAESYYADPSDFNDPLDCKPVITVDTDLLTLEQVCHRVVASSVSDETARKTIEHLRYESGQYETQDEAEADLCRRLADTTKDFLFHDFERCGVLSLAARWNCPLMWSHYADKHRGLCIEYDLNDHRCASLDAVDYSTTGDIRVSDIKKWKIDGSAEAEQVIRKAFFYAKANEWQYEQEWRDVYRSPGSHNAPIKIGAVYFGLRCDPAVVTSVVKLRSGTDHPVTFFQIYREDNTFLLKRREIDIEEEEMFGVRSYVAWSFDDLDADTPKPPSSLP